MDSLKIEQSSISIWWGNDEYVVSGNYERGWSVTKFAEGRAAPSVTYNVVCKRGIWRCDCPRGYRIGLMRTADEYCKHVKIVVKYEKSGGQSAVNKDIEDTLIKLISKAKDFLNS